MTEAVGSKTDVVQRFVHLEPSWDTQYYEAIHSSRLQTHSVFMGTGSKCQRSANVHKMPVLNTQDGGHTEKQEVTVRGEQTELVYAGQRREGGAQNGGKRRGQRRRRASERVSRRK